MRHNLVQSFVLDDEEIKYFGLIFGPIQGCLVIWARHIDLIMEWLT